MISFTLTKELAATLMQLQDTYDALRQKQDEVDALKRAHESELKAKQLEIDSLNARLLLNQILQYVKPAEASPPSDDYQP